MKHVGVTSGRKAGRGRPGSESGFRPSQDEADADMGADKVSGRPCRGSDRHSVRQLPRGELKQAAVGRVNTAQRRSSGSRS